MDQIKTKYKQLSRKKGERKFEETTITRTESAGNLVFFEKESQNFLLNNILMSFQFFRNYEKEVNILRENWFKDVSLEKHNKQCFYGDTIHRLVASNIKFRTRHGGKKNVEEFLHPLRIYISNDNVKAAFDPSALDRCKFQVNPQYMFTVKPCENDKKEKAGYVTLMEYKIIDPESSNSSTPVLASPVSPNFPNHFLRQSEHFEKNTTNSQRRFTVDWKARRLTKTEKLIAFQNKEENNKRPASMTPTIEGKIPINCFYKYVKLQQRITPKKFSDFRMNNYNQPSNILPKKCFQVVLVKQQLEKGKRAACNNKNQSNDFITTKNILNSAAFMGNFCDNLIDKLAETLNLDYYYLNDSYVHEESVMVDQRGLVTCITPTVEIIDWSNFIKIFEETKGLTMSSEIIWPTAHMKKTLRILPCHLVAKCYWVHTEENEDYEKEWRIEFVKGEEYLLLHMMHAHVRCFLFVLALYKSFIEKEINTASFNPKHILHHLFWKVHQNFLAWPEDKPGDTLLCFLRSLYKKIQNKSLYHFFIKSRNLFASSHPKDLHKAQSIIKMILDDPIPFVMKAMKNLKLEQEFYHSLDLGRLNTILKNFHKPVKEAKKMESKKEKKTVTFEDDKELLWRKQVIRQIQKEKKLEEQEKPKLSVESIDVQYAPQLKFNTPSGQQLIELFIFHFVEMGLKSIEYDILNQALMYLFQIQKLLEFFPVEKFEQIKLFNLNRNISKLKQECDKLKKKFNYKDTSEEIIIQTSATKLHEDHDDNVELRNFSRPKEIKITNAENTDETNEKKDEEKEGDSFSTQL